MSTGTYFWIFQLWVANVVGLT